MSDEQALLAAIWAGPHEDTPRLVYADWLQETGDPANVARAEFIRLQCELARLDEDDPRQRELARRPHTLLKQHRAVWNSGLPKSLQRVQFVRGFPAPSDARAPREPVPRADPRRPRPGP